MPFLRDGGSFHGYGGERLPPMATPPGVRDRQCSVLPFFNLYCAIRSMPTQPKLVDTGAAESSTDYCMILFISSDNGINAL